MFPLRTNSGKAPHPGSEAICERLRSGEINRRDFLRTASWLGISGVSARAFAASVTGVGALLAGTDAKADETPKQGGALRFALPIQKIADPSSDGWGEAGYVFRNSLEYLTWVDPDNIVRPYLAESWDPSSDLKTWNFKLRSGVKWSNGDDFTAEDVAFTIKRWLAPTSKSSNKSAFAVVRDVEIRSPLEFTLHLDKPTLPIAEMLSFFNCVMLHRKFDETGANWSKNPIGTGPYTMTEYGVGQRATFKRRDGYWGDKPYLDEIHYIDLGTDAAAQIAALAAGQVDILRSISVSELDIVKKLPNVELLTAPSAQTLAIRMQCDQKPFDDVRVRRALQLCADNSKMLEIAYRGMGQVAENHHVAPFHPEYFKLPPLKRDVGQAKHLLQEAGHGEGVDLTLTVGNTHGRWEQDTCQVLQQNCLEAGIRIKLDVRPPAEFWPIWNKVPFGATFWDHRPLAIMTHNVAYRSGAAFNESHFSSQEFDAALDRAMSLIDPKERATAMEPVERILRDEAPIIQPYWIQKFTATSSRVKNYRLHPSNLANLFGVWLA